MSVAENAAISRRVDALEASVRSQELVLVRTTIIVCDRDVEPEYKTASEVMAAAEWYGLHPPIREVRRFVDLELLIDPVTGTRKLRHRQRSAEARARFDALVEAARIIEVEVRCHERQLAVIRSVAPVEAVFGGNRAGKSYSLAWWLFRRWMLRGGVGALFWWVSPEITKAIEYGAWLIAGANGSGDGALWPVEVFAGLPRITLQAKAPVHTLIDGSILKYVHAHHSGSRGGDNLKSANVRDLVVDELTAIHDRKNWQQLVARVSQSGGHILTGSTRASGHWSTEAIESNSLTGGGSIHVTEVDLFHNPWMAYAADYQLFLNDKTFTAHQIEEIISLPRVDQADACRSRMTRPESLLNHLGIAVEASDRLWTQWTGEHVIADREARHTHLVIPGDDGKPRRLRNITAAMLAEKWPKTGATRFTAWAGMDFNRNPGHAVLFELFGEGPDEAHALANRSQWVVLVTDEVEVKGPTLALAQALATRAGSIPVYCDPTGALTGHEARGSGGSTDIAEVRKAGHPAVPANSYRQRTDTSKPAHAAQLSVTDSRNVVHRLMFEGRLYLHTRCTGLLDALEHDKPTKVSGVHSLSDKRSGFSDAMRYGLWSVFKDIVKTSTSAAA